MSYAVWHTSFWCSHVLKMGNQRVYLLKLLRDQGLSRPPLNIVFDALVLFRLRYAVPVWSGFLSVKFKKNYFPFYLKCLTKLECFFDYSKQCCSPFSYWIRTKASFKEKWYWKPTILIKFIFACIGIRISTRTHAHTNVCACGNSNTKASEYKVDKYGWFSISFLFFYLLV